MYRFSDFLHSQAGNYIHRHLQRNYLSFAMVNVPLLGCKRPTYVGRYTNYVNIFFRLKEHGPDCQPYLLCRVMFITITYVLIYVIECKRVQFPYLLSALYLNLFVESRVNGGPKSMSNIQIRIRTYLRWAIKISGCRSLSC
jgi:hypothetical protein